MDTSVRRTALALGLIAGTMTTPAFAQQSSQDPVQTNAPLTTQQQLEAQARQIQQQQEQIDQLEEQLREVTTILSNRVDRVEGQTESGRVVMSNPAPRLEGVDSRHAMTFVGAVQVTAGGVEEDRPAGSSAPLLHGGTEIKRARIGIQGTAFDDFAYAVEFDLAGTGTVASAARDLWVQYNGFRPFALTVGNMKPLNGLEGSFSDRSNAQTFVESSMMSTMLTAPGTRYIGLRATTGGQTWSGALGVYGDDVNNNGVGVPSEEGYGVHGRLTLAPIATPTSLLHLGASGYWRQVATGRASNSADPLVSQLRVRAQPESTIDAARLVDTGNLAFADTVSALSIEGAGFLGPVGLQAEWAEMRVTQLAGRPDLEFSGGYVGANWFLTGESRVYDPRSGVFTRFAPHNLFDPRSDAWGAWELAARWSTIDLNSDENLFLGTTLIGARGGEETNYTLGLNWYWNPYFRIMLNYVHADADKHGNSTSGPGPDQSATADLLAVRVQQEW